MDRRELMLAAATDAGQVFAALSTDFAVRAEPAARSRWSCLDTADWRLHRAGMTLRDARRGRQASLILCNGQADRVVAPTGLRAWPQRVDALPAAVRDRIASTVGIRALLARAEVDVRSIPLRLLDDDDKTRVRLRIDQQSLTAPARRALPLRVVVSPLRGYERDAQRCTDLLRSAMTQVDLHLAPATIAMKAAGHTPGQPTVPALQLDPNAPVVESVAMIMNRWLDAIDSVSPGVLDDIDPEYLHELRTSVRAVRSMLSMSDDVLPATAAAHFSAEFAWLGQITTPMRDLDVHLLELAGNGTVDVTDLEDLGPLREYLAGQRRRALRTLRTNLRSARANSLGPDWRATLAALTAPALTGPTTSEAAAAQAQQAYRRIRKAAANVTAQTPADDLHRLRRRCKRMRYLLQDYESVYAPRPYRAVLTLLKKLQDCLGDIQDADVQRRELAQIAATLIDRGVAVDTVLAVGALRDRTSARDVAARHDLTGQLERFCAPSTRAEVLALAARQI